MFSGIPVLPSSTRRRGSTSIEVVCPGCNNRSYQIPLDPDSMFWYITRSNTTKIAGGHMLKTEELIQVLEYSKIYLEDGSRKHWIVALISVLEQAQLDKEPDTSKLTNIDSLIGSIQNQATAKSDTWMSADQRAFFHQSRLSEFVGPGVTTWIQEMRSRHSAAPKNMARDLRSFETDVETHLHGIRWMLAGLGPTAEVLKHRRDAVEQLELLRIGFDEDVAVDSLEDLERASRDWIFIIRQLLIATGESPASVTIFEVEKGSFIITLAVASIAIRMIMKTLNVVFNSVTEGAKMIEGSAKAAEGVAKARQSFLELRKMELQLRAMVLENESQELKSFQARVAALRELNEQDATTILLDEHGNPQTQHDHEVKAGLKKAIHDLTDHILKGGSVVPVDKATKRPLKEFDSLTQVQSKIHEIEGQSKQRHLLSAPEDRKETPSA